MNKSIAIIGGGNFGCSIENKLLFNNLEVTKFTITNNIIEADNREITSQKGCTIQD